MNDEINLLRNGEKLVKIVTTVKKRFFSLNKMNPYNIDVKDRGNEYLTSEEFALNKSILRSKMIEPRTLNITYNHLICESFFYNHKNELQAYIKFKSFMKTVPVGGIKEIIFHLWNDKNLDFIGDEYESDKGMLQLAFSCKETKVIENEIILGNKCTHLCNRNLDCFKNDVPLVNSETTNVNGLINSLNTIKKRYFLLKDLNQFDIEKEQEQLSTEKLALEDSILGAILRNDGFWRGFYFIIDEAIFYNPKNQIIFEAISYLFNTFSSTRKQDVIEQLKKEGNLDLVGGEDYVKELINNSLSREDTESVEGKIQMNNSCVFINDGDIYCLSK